MCADKLALNKLKAEHTRQVRTRGLRRLRQLILVSMGHRDPAVASALEEEVRTAEETNSCSEEEGMAVDFGICIHSMEEPLGIWNG